MKKMMFSFCAAAAGAAYLLYRKKADKGDKKKITVNMMSRATSVPGQGVGSAYVEQVGLIRKCLGSKFTVKENSLSKADITHFHTINPEYLLLKPFIAHKGRSVGSVHFLPETIEKSLKLPFLFKKVFYRYMIGFYKSMDQLVTVNPYFIKKLAGYGIDPKKVTYIPNYVSSGRFYPLHDDEAKKLRDSYGIPQNAFVVVCAGQLQVRKGFFDFLEIAKQRADMYFMWAGDFSFGAITDGYKEIKKIREAPPSNLRFLGMIPRSRMNEIYNIADVLLLPSFDELFPMTVLEAMSAHLPVVLRDLKLYKYILSDSCLYADTIKGFINELLRLRDDPAFYEKRKKASAKGNRFYSKEHVAKMWEELYSSLLDDASLIASEVLFFYQ